MISMILDQHPDRPPMARGLKAIGYWFNDHHPDLPKPENYVDPNWNQTEREVVAKYLDAGKVVAAWRGWSTCRLCGKRNGSCCYGDGKFVWPQGFSHYVKDHVVRPPDEFSKHAFQQILDNGFPKTEPSEPPAEKPPVFRRVR